MLTWLVTSCFLQPSEEPLPEADLLVLADVSVVVVDGRIDAVHDNPVDAKARAGDDTAILRGPRVTAGFVDAHAHPAGYGRVLGQLDLTGIGTYAETLDRIAAVPAGTDWLHGRGWDQNDWADAPEGGWPTAADLDARVGERPVALRRVDGHAVWVSSAGLAAAGIDADTPEPVGGQIVRGADGAPTGVLIDNAMELLPEPEPTKVEIRRWVVAGVEALARQGLTGVHVMGIDDATLDVLEYLDRKGTLALRMWVYVTPGSEAAQRLASEGPWAGDRVRVVGVKAYADGALGSRGALLSAPYADQPDHSGLALTSLEELTTLTTRLTPMGAQVAIHAIGDLGVRHGLDAIAAAHEANPGTDVRHRIEHAQVVHPDDLPRFAALDVVASVQPTHATSDMPWAESRLGPERLPWSYAWRSLHDAGAVLAFGSDAPVEVPDPALGLWVATTRSDSAGNPPGGWRLEEAVTLDEAIAAYTSGAAHAVGDEARVGTIEPGKLADLTVWETVDGRLRPLATVVGGAVLWRQPATTQPKPAPAD